MPAGYTTDDGRFQVIRPLIECAEADIAATPATSATRSSRATSAARRTACGATPWRSCSASSSRSTSPPTWTRRCPLPQAGAVPAALPARERGGRRAPRPLLVHRLRRGAGGAARTPTAASARPTACPPTRRSCCRPCATRCARAAPGPRARRAAARGRPGRLCRLRRGALLREAAARHAAPRDRCRAALRRAELAAGVRSPDARHRAAARRQRGRAPVAAPRVCGAARRVPPARSGTGFSPPMCRHDVAGAVLDGVRACRSTSPPATSTSSCCRRFGGGTMLDPFQVYRALRLINPSPYMYYCAFGDLGGRLLARGAGEAAGPHATLRPIAGTRPRGRPPPRTGQRARAAGRPEGERRARDAGRSRAQRPRPRGGAGSVHVDPYRVIERYSHVMHIVSGVQGCSRRAATPSTCSPPPSRPARWSARRRCARCRSSTSSSRSARGSTAAPWATSAHGGDMDQAITIRTLVFDGGRVQLPGRRRRGRRQRARAEHDECSPRARRCACALDRQGGPVMTAGDAGRAAADRQLRPSPTTWCRPSWCSAPRCACTATTSHGRAGAGARADAPVHLAGARHAAGCRRLDGHDPRRSRALVPCSACASGTRAIVEVFGGKVVRAAADARQVVDGEARRQGRLPGAAEPCDEVGRYHSLIAQPATLPEELEVCRATPRARSWACAPRFCPSRACSSTRRAC
jgi:hypothetical protein